MEDTQTLYRRAAAGERDGVLGDLTLTQVVASALASVTSLALSRQIGVAGSLIGAAVGSVAATVATQLYRSAITRSVEGLRGGRGKSDARTRAHARTGGHDTLGKRAVTGLGLGLLACAVLAGVLAVGAYATGVNVVTRGQGIGTQAPVFHIEAPTADEADGDQAAESAADAAEPDAVDSMTEDQVDAATSSPFEAPSESDPLSPTTEDGVSQQGQTQTPAADTMDNASDQPADAQQPPADGNATETGAGDQVE